MPPTTPLWVPVLVALIAGLFLWLGQREIRRGAERSKGQEIASTANAAILADGALLRKELRELAKEQQQEIDQLKRDAVIKDDQIARLTRQVERCAEHDTERQRQLDEQAARIARLEARNDQLEARLRGYEGDGGV